MLSAEMQSQIELKKRLAAKLMSEIELEEGAHYPVSIR